MRFSYVRHRGRRGLGVSRAQARDKVKRNVVLLCDVPRADTGVRIEDISPLVGRNSTKVTETVYRKQIRPVLLAGAEGMDGIFEDENP